MNFGFSLYCIECPKKVPFLKFTLLFAKQALLEDTECQNWLLKRTRAQKVEQTDYSFFTFL